MYRVTGCGFGVSSAQKRHERADGRYITFGRLVGFVGLGLRYSRVAEFLSAKELGGPVFAFAFRAKRNRKDDNHVLH